MGGFTERFILLLIKSRQVINKGVLSRGRFVGPPLLPAGVEGPILLLTQHIPALPPGASPDIPGERQPRGWRS